VSTKHIYRVAVVVLSILTSLLIAEATLRVIGKPQPALSGWRALKASTSENNQLGFRGQRIEYAKDDFVIVLLGDSQVEAVACAYERMPERRLAAYLNSAGRRVRVFSVAASGYGQDQQLLALREYFEKFRADLVVHWQTPKNDIWNNIFPTNLAVNGTPKPTFWLESGQLRGPSEGIGQPISETPPLKLQLLWRRLSHWSRDRHWEKLYPPAYRPLTEVNEPVKTDWQQHLDRNLGIEELDSEKTHWSISLTPRSERMLYGLDLTRQLLQQIERLTRSNGGQFTIFTAYNVPFEESSIEEGVHVLNGKYYRTSKAQYYANLSYLNSGFNFHHIPVTLEPWRVGPDNGHLNEHATDQVMKDLAGRIEALIPVAKKLKT
jgi:hypothetical protein